MSLQTWLNFTCSQKYLVLKASSGRAWVMKTLQLITWALLLKKRVLSKHYWFHVVNTNREDILLVKSIILFYIKYACMYSSWGFFLMSAFSVYLLSRKWVNLYTVYLFRSVFEITLALNVHIALKWTWNTNRQCEKLPATLIIEWINIDIKYYCHFVITPSFHSTPLGLINYA